MDLSAQKEKFSDAYLQAVAAVAGFGLAKPQPDDDSVDWIIVSKGASDVNRRPRLEVQLKSTARNVVHETNLHYPLEMKNYEELRDDDLIVPRILVVLTLPEALDNWLHQTENEMVIQHCAYWMSLKGQPYVPNEDNITVYVPRTQMFTPDILTKMMRKINDSEAL